MSEHTLTEYVRLVAVVETARAELNATRWWQVFKRQEAAKRYKYALLRGAFWEIDHGVTT